MTTHNAQHDFPFISAYFKGNQRSKAFGHIIWKSCDNVGNIEYRK